MVEGTDTHTHSHESSSTKDGMWHSEFKKAGDEMTNLYAVTLWRTTLLTVLSAYLTWLT